MMIFTITFLGIWFQNRKRVRLYKPYGFTVGAILIGFEVVTILLLVIDGSLEAIWLIIFADIVAFFRLAAFTIIGIYYCARLGMASFPYTMQLFGVPEVEQVNVDDTQEDVASDISLQESDLVELDTTSAYETGEAEDVPRIVFPAAGMLEMIISACVVALGGMIFSVLLFWLTEPTVSELIDDGTGTDIASQTWIAISLTILVALTFAFAEEIIFRLGMQSYFAKHFGWQGEKYWWAILVTTIIWTIGHVGVLDPNWVKMVQIFPIGLALGWLFKKYGVESTIIAHSLFNLIVLVPSQYLIS